MPKTPPSFLAHLRASEYADSIYYADLFRINGKVWALTGTGKSRAGMEATASRIEDDLARDSVAFVREGTQLFARSDLGAVAPEQLDSEHPLHSVAAVVYCFSEEETAKAFANRPLELVEADANFVGLLLTKSLYPAVLAPHFFDETEMHQLGDGKRRLERWNALTNGADDVRWLLAPYMPSVEAKGELYSSFKL